MDVGAATSVVVVALLVGELRDSGVGWLLWPLGRRGGRCFGERWRFEDGECMLGEIPCLALVGLTAAASVGVVSFLKASSWLLSPFDPGESHHPLDLAATMLLCFFPFLKAPSWRPTFA